jgi:aspartyl-tRNA(Asn)/glutamyl-tRNA(Gln) amidotransferase subunit C
MRALVQSSWKRRGKMSRQGEQNAKERAGETSSPVIDAEEVRRIARLAKVALGDDEIGWFRARLGAVLEYVAKLDEVDTEGVEPTFHVITLTNVLREDAVLPSLPQEVAVGNAPRATDGFIIAPRIIETEGSGRA